MVAALAAPAAAVAADWPAYLHDPQHSSWSPAKAITPANAAGLHQVWRWVPPAVAGKPVPRLQASPVVVGDRVYIGSNTGVFYALRAGTGGVAWKRQLDVSTKLTCGARGITATATVAPDPVSAAATVYVSGARSLYALDAATGAVRWQTQIGPAGDPTVNDYYNWSSPTVVAGHIYLGISSFCDDPLVRAGVIEIDQHSGAVEQTWYSVPDGSIGGSVWTSVAASASGANLWVATGNECDPTVNACPDGNLTGDSLSMVRLSGSLARLDAWQVPGAAGSGHDWDFGSSPTLFGGAGSPAGVGACNKNGVYYALGRTALSAGPLWSATRRLQRGARLVPARRGLGCRRTPPVRRVERDDDRRRVVSRLAAAGRPRHGGVRLAAGAAVHRARLPVRRRRRRDRRRHPRKLHRARRRRPVPGRGEHRPGAGHDPDVQPDLRPAGVRRKAPVRRHRDQRAARARALTGVVGGRHE